jgi:hypothetical protein
MTIEIILLALSPIFILFVTYEFIKHRHYYDIKDSMANSVLALMHQASDAIALLLLMPFFYWLHDYRLFDIELSAIKHRTISIGYGLRMSSITARQK